MYFCNMEELRNIKRMSNADIIRNLGERFREYRITARMTQKEVAEKSGVSLLTIRRFELGYSYNITMSNFLALLKAIDYTDGIKELLPDIPVSPYQLARQEQKQPKRVRHGKQP